MKDTFWGFRGPKSGMGRRGNVRAWVAVLVSAHIWTCVKEIRRVSSKIMYVRICIEFWSGISVHAPEMERSEEERDSFWKELKGCMEAC